MNNAGTIDGRGARWRLGAVMLFLAAAIVFCSLPIYSYPLPPQDEGILLVYPERILAGDVPCRDFRCSYGPANFYAIAGCFKVFGVSVTVERSVGLAHRLALALGVAALVGRRGVLVGLLAGAASWAATLALGLTAYAWVAAAACLVWSLWCTSLRDFRSARSTAATAVAGGFLCGLAVLFRPDVIVIAVAAGLPVFLTTTARRRTAYLCGGAVPAALFAAYLAAASPRLVIGNLVNAVAASRNLRAVKPPMTPDERVLLWLVATCAAATLAVGVARFWRSRRDPRGHLLLSAGLLSLGALQQALQYPDLGHIMFAGCVVFGLWVLAVTDVVGPAVGRAGVARQLAVVAIAIAVFATFAGDTLLSPTASAVRVATGVDPHAAYEVVHRGRSHPAPDPQDARDMCSLLDQVEAVASPGDALVVASKDLDCTLLGHTSFYYLLPHLRPATYHLEMFLGTTISTGPGPDFYEDVKAARILILDCNYDGPESWRDRVRDAGGELHPVPADFVLQGRHGPYELYVANRRDPR